MKGIAKYFILFSVPVLMLASPSTAISLEHRSGLEFRLGMRGDDGYHEETHIDGVVNTSGTDNLMFSMGFSHWVEHDVALTLTLSILAGQSDNRTGRFGVINEDYAVVSFLLGGRYYFYKSNYDSPWFPYLAFGAGPVIGASDRNTVDDVVINESRTVTAYGAYFGGGMDVAFGRRILLGLNLGYHAMTDFARPIGGRENYSDPEFGLTFIFTFGGHDR